ARHSFAEHGDVRVVATKNPLIDRLEQSPDRRRGGARRRGPKALLRRHPGSLTRVPEGDSLARAARRLQVLVGERVEVETPHPRAAVKRIAERLDGRRLLGVEAAGKNLLLRFEDGIVLRSHLRMSGRWQVHARGSKLVGRPWLVLRGAEREAVLWNGPVLELDDHAVRRLGPDILAEPPDLDAMVANLRRNPTREVGDALLDQRLVAGIGNVWRAEALWQARVSPWRRLGDVSNEELERVLGEAARLMRAALDGARSQRAVYRRAGRPCPHCGTPIRSRGPSAPARLPTRGSRSRSGAPSPPPRSTPPRTRASAAPAATRRCYGRSCCRCWPTWPKRPAAPTGATTRSTGPTRGSSTRCWPS